MKANNIPMVLKVFIFFVVLVTVPVWVFAWPYILKAFRSKNKSTAFRSNQVRSEEQFFDKRSKLSPQGWSEKKRNKIISNKSLPLYNKSERS
jgi:hypothetical protein